ncbi:hypothetical protein ACOTHJ_13715 [Achromobacter xylosoxidans]
MNAKTIEIALANISARRYSLESVARSLGRLNATPVSIRELMVDSNAAQTQAQQQIEQLRSDLVTLAEPVLMEWLMHLGFVYGERAQVSMADAECYFDKVTGVSTLKGGKTVPTMTAQRYKVDSMSISGVISELRLDQYRNSLTMVLDQGLVEHCQGGHTDRPVFDLNTKVHYSTRGKWRSQLSATVEHDNRLLVVLPIRQADRDDIISIKKVTS